MASSSAGAAVVPAPAAAAAPAPAAAEPDAVSWAAAAARTASFWARAGGIYLSYKAAQARAAAARAAGWPPERVAADVWAPQHAAAGAAMHALCVDLRGFYLKAGQFLGARGDFVPEAVCRALGALHDRVPPMPPAQAAAAIEAELGGVPLADVFEWIDLDRPLGSASIAQVHKARLRWPPDAPRPRWWAAAWWRRRRGGDADPGWAPLPPAAQAALLTGGAAAAAGGAAAALAPAAHAPVDAALAARHAPADGLVAVKIQYPNALPTMALDLRNLRGLAAFLSRTELRFDLVSAVDELAAQIRLEFDFRREAAVQAAVARQFEGLGGRIVVPRPVPGLVTRRLLVMSFLDGVPLTRLRDDPGYASLRPATRRAAARRVLARVSEAYGRMVLLDGLFQADGHPGNILVMAGGAVGIIDYGQSKRLPDAYRAAFARLVLALADGDAARGGAPPPPAGAPLPAHAAAAAAALDALGVVTERDDARLKAEMARGMFDTTGSADPFDPASPIKQMGLTTFPRDMFFVLRVVQLLRGMADGMGVAEFSAAAQWAPFARAALRQGGMAALPPPGGGGGEGLARHISQLEA